MAPREHASSWLGLWLGLAHPESDPDPHPHPHQVGGTPGVWLKRVTVVNGNPKVERRALSATG